MLAIRGSDGATLSAGLGMLQEFADQPIILDYGTWITWMLSKNTPQRSRVSLPSRFNRFPSTQPHEFVKELRKLTLEKDIVLIFDEMITGFRAGCKGAEGFFKVKPDISLFGKVPGGGMPTGIIAGLAKCMNWVDGDVCASMNMRMRVPGPSRPQQANRPC